MNKNDFKKWIDDFIVKNNIDRFQTFEITTNGRKHIYTIENVIDYIKMISAEEQESIKRMLETIVNRKLNVVDYFQCLSVGIATTTDELYEENEEAM